MILDFVNVIVVLVNHLLGWHGLEHFKTDKNLTAGYWGCRLLFPLVLDLVISWIWLKTHKEVLDVLLNVLFCIQSFLHVVFSLSSFIVLFNKFVLNISMLSIQFLQLLTFRNDTNQGTLDNSEQDWSLYKDLLFLKSAESLLFACNCLILLYSVKFFYKVVTCQILSFWSLFRSWLCTLFGLFPEGYHRCDKVAIVFKVWDWGFVVFDDASFIGYKLGKDQ